MLNESLIKEDFEEFCKKHDLQYPYIEIQQYDIRENFYKLHEDMWDDMQEEFEDIEIDIDSWFKSDYLVMPDSFPITQELYDMLIQHYNISDFDKWVDNEGVLLDGFENKTYKDLPDDMKEYLNEFWDTLTVDDIAENDFIAKALGIDDIEAVSYTHLTLPTNREV